MIVKATRITKVEQEVAAVSIDQGKGERLKQRKNWTTVAPRVSNLEGQVGE
jgi:hypothetical protein